jgi:zinc transport system substrate-binding protein
MRHQLVLCAVLIFGLASNSQAAVPSVAVDIAPLHSLVSQVMEDVGEPTLLIPAGASPHHHTLRPSDAKALEDADVVFWIGKRLSPWLDKAVNNLASSAQSVEVLHLEGTSAYLSRKGANFESKKHKEAHDDDKGEDHKDEKDDPHAWLDPENAKLWTNHISEVLSKLDPENAATYSRNAKTAIASLDALIQSTQTQLSELGKPQFIVFHDAYQYFEKRFGIPAAGSIKLGDAEDPSPARIREVQAIVKELNVTCVFTEPQFNPGIVKTVFEGTSVSTVGVMDPLGASLPRGSGLYQALIQGMVNSLTQCK